MSSQLVERLQAEFGEVILGTSSQHGDEAVRVAGKDLPKLIQHLRDREGCELLLDIIGVDYPERPRRFEINYALRSLFNHHSLRVKVDAEEGEAIPTISNLYRSANWHEREVYDLFGMRFQGHPDLRRILCHHEFEGHALRKDYPIERGQTCTTPERLFSDHEIAEAARRADAATGSGIEGDVHPSDLLTVNIGPSHPATHGCLRAEVLLDGETIVAAKTEIGYLHRCFEKEAEDHTWAAIMPYTDRLNYCSSMLNNVIYAHAVEKMLGVRRGPGRRKLQVDCFSCHLLNERRYP